MSFNKNFSFEPYNRHLLLAAVQEEKEEEESTILVPDDYVIKKSPHGLYKIKKVAEDCERFDEDDVNKFAVVNDGMVEEIKVRDRTYYLLLENYVYGLFYDKRDYEEEY
jgi:hypothetical protein